MRQLPLTRVPAWTLSFYQRFDTQLDELRQQGLFKSERVIASPQGGQIRANDADVINLCANNYLGLASHPAIREAAHRAIDRYGYGMASVRFICGTQTVHKQLEAALSRFLGTEDTILYSSCWDANGGLFETVLGEEDAIISDALNHASIIDGIRLCKARRLRYANRNLAELEQHLKDTQDCRTRLIATDGVFSMDGSIAPLAGDLRPRGQVRRARDGRRLARHRLHGRRRPRHARALRRRWAASTSSPAPSARRWAAAAAATPAARPTRSPGCASARGPICSRTAFRRWSPPSRCARSISSRTCRSCAKRCSRTRRKFRAGMQAAGFKLLPGEHPIIPVMIGDAALAARFADRLLGEGVYVIGFSFPVVPKGEARIRTQMSAGLTDAQLDRALAAFIKVGRELELIK